MLSSVNVQYTPKRIEKKHIHDYKVTFFLKDYYYLENDNHLVWNGGTKILRWNFYNKEKCFSLYKKLNKKEINSIIGGKFDNDINTKKGFPILMLYKKRKYFRSLKPLCRKVVELPFNFKENFSL